MMPFMLEEKPFVRLFSPDYADYLGFKNPPSKYLREALNQCCPKLRRASAIVTASVTETKPDSFSVFQKVSAQPARPHPTSMEGMHRQSPAEDSPRIEWKDDPRPLINSSQKL